MAAGDINMKEFARAIKYYMHAFECSKERPGELNKKEFVLFWEKFQELYNKIDANKGIFYTLQTKVSILYLKFRWFDHNRRADRLPCGRGRRTEIRHIKGST